MKTESEEGLSGKRSKSAAGAGRLELELEEETEKALNPKTTKPIARKKRKERLSESGGLGS